MRVRKQRHWSHWLALICMLVPLSVAFIGPFIATGRSDKGAPSTVGQGYLLGTDFAGRDVLDQVLTGGYLAILLATLATVIIYLVAVPIGIAAGLTRHRWVDELFLRPSDVVLAIPSLIVVLTAATAFPGQWWPLLLGVVIVGIAEVTRLTRAAALEIAGRPIVEAMRLHHESWLYLAFGYVARQLVGTLIASAGLQFTAALALVATASFLGMGISPQHSDWATMIEANRAAMMLQPWPVVVPAILIALLVVGVNLLVHNVASSGAETRLLTGGSNNRRQDD